MNSVEALKTYLKGLAMGTADAVPGVSGGTIALIVGIYERLIDAITSFNHVNATRAFDAFRERNLSGLREIIEDMDLVFLGVLLLGIFTAVVTVLSLMHVMLENFPIATFGFFFGLIAVSAVVLFRHTAMDGQETWAAALAGFITAFTVSGYATTSLGHGAPIVFISGIVAVSAMVLPGISGSLMLVILGQYEYMSAAISGVSDATFSALRTFDISGVPEAASPVIVFMAGGVVGVFTVAHGVKHALENYRKMTMAFLVSLVLGALRAPVIEAGRAISEAGRTWPEALPVFALASLVGGFAVYILDLRTSSLEY